MPDWETMSLQERNLAYNNRAHVGDAVAQRHLDTWTAASQQLRAAHPHHLDLPYANGERTRWDLYPASDSAAPCMVYLHGGYWQRGSREIYACLAQGMLAQGWSVAMPGYTLAPNATLTQIVAELRIALGQAADEAAALSEESALYRRRGDALLAELEDVNAECLRLTEEGERLMRLAAPLVEGFDSLRKMFLDLQSGAERVLRLLEQLGFDLHAQELFHAEASGQWLVLAGLEEFREHLGGHLTITLLRRIGEGFEVHEMDPRVVEREVRREREDPTRHVRRADRQRAHEGATRVRLLEPQLEAHHELDPAGGVAREGRDDGNDA
jgi:hypothetical protein